MIEKRVCLFSADPLRWSSELGRVSQRRLSNTESVSGSYGVLGSPQLLFVATWPGVGRYGRHQGDQGQSSRTHFWEHWWILYTLSGAGSWSVHLALGCNSNGEPRVGSGEMRVSRRMPGPFAIRAYYRLVLDCT